MGLNLRSFGVRLSIWHATVCLTTCAALAVVSLFWLHHHLSSVLGKSLEHRAEHLEALLQLQSQAIPPEEIITEISASYAPEKNDRFIRISNQEGTVLYESGEPADGNFHPTQIPRQGSAENRQATYLQSQNMLVANRVSDASREKYLIEVGASLVPIDQAVWAYLVMFLVATPFVLLIAIIGGFVLTKQSLQPIREIITEMNDITSCNLRKRLSSTQTSDELETLATAINSMIARLDASFSHAQRFATQASHELRTPLTIIIGELEALLREKNLPSVFRDRVGSVLEEAEHLAKLVKGLFAITRLEAGELLSEPIPFDFSSLARSTCEQLLPIAQEKNLSVQMHTEPNLEVLGDRVRLKQVIVNLLDNAIKFTPSGGMITLTTQVDGGSVRLDIQDNGFGISEEALPYVFESFYRAKDERIQRTEGGGIGLSIVKSICETHRGTVMIRNNSEGGCTVTIRLPLHQKKIS
jgi:signal transduction histidine kinase